MSDSEGKKQREQTHTASLRSFAPKERRLAAAGWECRLFNDGRDLIIVLGSGEGASRERALRMQEREGGIEEPA